MELKNTIELMISDHYEARFKAEYYQTKIRRSKLYDLIVKIEAGTCSFEPVTPLDVLKSQLSAMDDYLYTLAIRSEIEGIDL